MRNIFKRIYNTMCVVIAWIDAPFITSMWMQSELQTYGELEFFYMNSAYKCTD